MRDDDGKPMQELPSAEVHVLDAGHFAMDTMPDEVAQYVRAYLQKVNI